MSSIKNKETPGDWEKHVVELLSSKIYTNFEIANAKASKAQYSTNISSEPSSITTLKRKRRKPARYSLQDEEDSENFDEENALSKIYKPATNEYPKPPEHFSSYPTQEICANNRLVAVDDFIVTTNESASPSVPGTSTSVDRSYIFRPLPIQVEEHRAKIPSPRIDNSTPVVLIENSSDYNPISLPRSISSTPVSHTNSWVHTNDEYQRQVLRQQNLINTRLKDHGEYLHILMNQQNATLQNSTVVEEDYKFDIPIATQEALLILEENLNNKELMLKLSKNMASVGGRDVKELVRRVMPRLIDNEVAKNYSYLGAKGKMKFSLLNLSNVIKEAVKLNPLTKSVTEKEIEAVISIWLSKANDRLKRKNTATDN